MKSHSRSHSKDSFSVLSMDTLRLFSHSQSRTVPSNGQTDLTRTQSSLSRCDPTGQLTAPIDDRFNEADSVPSESQSDRTILPATVLHPKPRKRRQSWLPMPQFSKLHSRSMSAYLTNDKSSSSMTYNAISDPILTSTTNVDVAESERVRYDELTREVMNKSEPFSQLSRTHDPDQAMADQPQYLTEKIETAETNLIRQGRLTRFGVAVSELLGKGHGTRFRRLEEEESFSLARMHAETANLCKDKIKNLTGNGRVRRKSVNITCPVYTSPDIRAHAEADPPLLSRDSQELLPLATEHPDIRSEFGSLSRSFNSALEKLNLLDTEHLNDTSHKVVENFYHTLKPSQLCPSTNIRNIKNKPHNPSQAHVSTQNDAVKETVPSNAGVDIAAHNTEVMLPSTTCGNQDSAPTVLPFSSKVEAYSHSQQPSSPLNDCSGEECDRVQSNQAGHPTVVSGLQMHPNTSEFSSAPPSTAAGSCKTPITVTDWPARPLVRSSSKCSRRNTADLAPKCTSKYGRALQEARGAMNRFLGLNKATKV